MPSKILCTLLLLIAGALCPLTAAPYNNYYDQDPSTKNALDSIKHQLGNHEAEIRVFEQKLENLDQILESLRDQLRENASQHKEMVKGSASSQEGKISSLESTSKTLTADLKQLHQHANDTTAALNGFKQKIQELDQRLAAQNKNIENLQSAMQSVLEAFQIKSEPAASIASGSKTYKVKNGDSLEKIARAHNTTIQAIKDLNGMTSDKIVVGKSLKIPE